MVPTWRRTFARFAVAGAAAWIGALGLKGEALAQLGSGLLGGNARGLGAGFVWTDLMIFQEWRIQHHALLGHHQLIDPEGQRIALGTLENCLLRFDELKRDKALPPYPQEVVVMLHGLGATRNFMQGLADYLSQEGDFEVVNMGYASTMGSMAEHAEALDSVIRHLDGAKRVHFVAHSMGNIVARRFLYNVTQLDADARPPVQFQRMVMISPPNHGAEIAGTFQGNRLAKLAVGDALQELAPEGGWTQLEQRLATPDFPFGIIVGGRADQAGYLPGIPGDDDALLSIATQKLVGATDFIQTKGVHQLMPRYKQVREATLRFLQHGYFVTENARQPL